MKHHPTSDEQHGGSDDPGRGDAAHRLTVTLDSGARSGLAGAVIGRIAVRLLRCMHAAAAPANIPSIATPLARATPLVIIRPILGFAAVAVTGWTCPGSLSGAGVTAGATTGPGVGAVAGRSASFLSMPVWGGAEALHRAAARARTGLPELHCSWVTLVLLPVPDRIAAVMTDLFERHGASGLDEEALLPGLRQSRHTHILRANLRSRAEASGAEVFVDSTCQELLTILCRRFPPGERRALVLIGHQDGAGIMCSDGFLPLDVLRGALQDEQLGFPYHSTDLAVCHVNEPDNLAETLQRAGCEVVFCRGQTGFFGRAYRTWIEGFGLLAACGALSLPALVERLP